MANKDDNPVRQTRYSPKKIKPRARVPDGQGGLSLIRRGSVGLARSSRRKEAGVEWSESESERGKFSLVTSAATGSRPVAASVTTRIPDRTLTRAATKIAQPQAVHLTFLNMGQTPMPRSHDTFGTTRPTY
jgi:hypothetical protein